MDPSFFRKGKNITTKAKSVKERRIVRSQLVGAPLIVAQSGLQSIVKLLSGGDDRVVDRLHLGDRLTVAEVLKSLSAAPPLTIMKLLDIDKGDQLRLKLGRLQSELDFVQSVTDLVASRDPLNPSLDAIAEAFRRRNLSGEFMKTGQDLKLQALMYG